MTPADDLSAILSLVEAATGLRVRRWGGAAFLVDGECNPVFCVHATDDPVADVWRLGDVWCRNVMLSNTVEGDA